MYYFIVNRTSGSGRAKKVWTEVKKELDKSGAEYQVFFTDHAGHAGELADEICGYAEECIHLVVVGGDGTVNEVMNGMHDFDKVRFGYIPTGSGNDFARGMKITGTPAENLQRILREETVQAVDIGEVSWKNGNGKRRFAISSGVGMDADVCKQALTSKLKKFLNKIRLGSMTYVCLTIKSLFTMPTTTARITFDHGETKTYEKLIFLAGMNQPYEGGGVPMAPRGNAFDGKLSVCLAWGISRLQAFFLLPILVAGKHEHIKGFQVVECESVELEIEQDMVLHADGEYCGDITHAAFRCLPGKLHMIL